MQTTKFKLQEPGDIEETWKLCSVSQLSAMKSTQGSNTEQSTATIIQCSLLVGKFGAAPGTHITY